MRFYSSLPLVVFVMSSLVLSACAHKGVASARGPVKPVGAELVAAKVTAPVTLRLKAEMGRLEKVAYTHRSTSKSYEDQQLRHQKEDALDFTSQAETLKIEPLDSRSVQKFTQVLSVLKKDGNADLHDFAMPDLGEKLEVTADSLGHIWNVSTHSGDKSGDYPPNSIFYVSPMSLPENPVSIGDTWTMQASWLSLEEMVPYQLDMVSILKGFWVCGDSKTPDTCAEIEISGDVGFQGPLSQTLNFKSSWQGRIYFAINAGTVVWSRVDSEERLIADKIRRDVDSCLESSLIEPAASQLKGLKTARCETHAKNETQVAP